MSASYYWSWWRRQAGNRRALAASEARAIRGWENLIDHIVRVAPWLDKDLPEDRYAYYFRNDGHSLRVQADLAERLSDGDKLRQDKARFARAIGYGA